jgi:hypothetical protein
MEDLGKFLSGTTGNRAADYASAGMRFAAGYAVTMAALGNWNSPFVAASIITLGSVALTQTLQRQGAQYMEKALTPLMLGAATAAFVFASKHYYNINQTITSFFEQHNLSRWNWAAQCSPEQIAYVDELLSLQKIAILSQLTSLFGVGALAYNSYQQVLTQQPSN